MGRFNRPVFFSKKTILLILRLKEMPYIVAMTEKEKQMKLTRFLFSRRFEVIVTPLSSDK